MKVYANKYNISEYRLPGYEYEVLNELNDCSNRCDANCSFHTRFLFEIDEIPGMDKENALKFQEKVYVETLKYCCVRITYSGSKSYHFIIELPKSMEEYCASHYKDIWKWFNKNYFDSLCDSQCVNPARLTRTPGVKRKDTGRYQRCVWDKPDNIFSCLSMLDMMKKDIRNIERTRNAFEAIRKLNETNRPKNTKTDGICKNWEVVTRYMNKSFPNITGNGVSSKWLYAAIKTCQKYNDNESLDNVLRKARNEKWTERELNRILK